MDLKNIKMPDLKKLDKKLLARLFLALAIIVILVIVIVVVKIIVGNHVGYDVIENRMVDAAKEYYSNDEDGIKKFKAISNGEISVNVNTLIDNGYLQSLDKLVPDKEVTCNGKVTVKMNNGYTLYTPFLDCGSTYKTKYLNEVITSSVVESSNGLYKMGNDYVFRGENLNNYVAFADKTWVILRVRENGNIRLLELTRREKLPWDDRYNLEVEGKNGINDFKVSRIRDSLMSLYENSEEFSDINKGYIVPTNLCIGKRSEDETDNSGNVECKEIVENWPVGLIQVNEFLIASLDNNCHKLTDNSCENYNYLSTLEGTYWSITPNTKRTDKVYKFNVTPFSTSAISYASIRAVIELDPNTIYVSGDGTLDNPYIIK